MKQNELIILGIAAAALLVVTKAKATGKTFTQTAKDMTTEILNNGQRYGNGWRYFSDGTAISPEGDYYRDGAMIWKKPVNGVGGTVEQAKPVNSGGATGSWSLDAMTAEPDEWGRIPGVLDA